MKKPPRSSERDGVSGERIRQTDGSVHRGELEFLDEKALPLAVAADNFHLVPAVVGLTHLARAVVFEHLAASCEDLIGLLAIHKLTHVPDGEHLSGGRAHGIGGRLGKFLLSQFLLAKTRRIP